MPRQGQIIPMYVFPHQETYINDNSMYSTAVTGDSGETRLLCVVHAPKGEDRKMITIDGGEAQLLSEIGEGSAEIYGQPLMNAYAAIRTGSVILQLMRISAENAGFANIGVFARYKVTPAVPGQPTGGGPTGNDPIPAQDAKMEVYFTTKYVEDLTDTEAYAPVIEGAPINGYTEVLLFSIFAKGRGTWGNSLRARLSSHPMLDKTNIYKNYLLEVFEQNGGNSPLKAEEFTLCFTPDALVNEASFYADDIINDPDTGSRKIQLLTNPDAFEALFEAYKGLYPDTVLTLETFDPLLGIDKTTNEEIPGYTIETEGEGRITLNSLTGINLDKGVDGDFAKDADPATRKTAIENAYKNAFAGVSDPDIMSRRKFPAHLILDANYEVETKKAIATLAVKRRCMAILDVGTTLTTKEDIFNVVNGFGSFVSERNHMIDPYYGKVKDPYSKKMVTVTSTYILASTYPIHFRIYNGKHVPLAGSNYGKLNGFIKNTVFPVFDEDIDWAIMDKLANAHINYVKITTKGQLARGMQDTRQTYASDLTEANNIFTVFDIANDCEKLNENYEYQFSEPKDLALFNKDIEIVVSNYRDAKVRSISARYDKNEWEAERGILHLYVELVCKDLVKTIITEIDVNK